MYQYDFALVIRITQVSKKNSQTDSLHDIPFSKFENCHLVLGQIIFSFMRLFRKGAPQCSLYSVPKIALCTANTLLISSIINLLITNK